MMLRLVACAAALAAAVQQTPFRAETRLVVLNATVRNDRGEVVPGLERGAFTVFENGKPQPITLFRSDDVPASIGLVIDNSRSMRTKRAKVEAAALAFARASNPQDELFVLNFADRPRIDVPMTADRQTLENGIARVDSIGGTALRDAIALGESYLAEHASRDRRALLVVTDGKDNASEISADVVTAGAQQRGVAIYAIGLLEGSDRSDRSARRDLERIAEATGGASYFPLVIDQMGSVALEVARQIRSQYTIGYTPLNQALDGTYRRIKVTVKGPHASGPFRVVTRGGYRAVASDATSRSGS
ncbi:MAG TPA: VWA domain-containing protein [Vicinamibacterales bacterium]|nr:VWA domain-containing protein [Vicinamibacterales bacterium]